MTHAMVIKKHKMNIKQAKLICRMFNVVNHMTEWDKPDPIYHDDKAIIRTAKTLSKSMNPYHLDIILSN